MLIVDSANLPRLVAGNKRESKEAQVKRWIEEQTANAVYLKDDDLSPANADRQIGQAMTSDQLEARLKKLNPNLIFETNPWTKNKALYHLRGGEKTYICAYHAGYMPEHSIMRVKEELVRDMSVGVPGGTPLDRKDLPKHEWGGMEKGWIFDDTEVRPGWKKVLIPWGEFKRGWRTVLIRLVEHKIATPTEVERIFGADDRQEWARHMGKRDIQLPW